MFHMCILSSITQYDRLYSTIATLHLVHDLEPSAVLIWHLGTQYSDSLNKAIHRDHISLTDRSAGIWENVTSYCT